MEDTKSLQYAIRPQAIRRELDCPDPAGSRQAFMCPKCGNEPSVRRTPKLGAYVVICENTACDYSEEAVKHLSVSINSAISAWIDDAQKFRFENVEVSDER